MRSPAVGRISLALALLVAVRSGRASAGAITVTPNPIDAGAIRVGASNSTAVTVANTGGNAVDVRDLNVMAANGEYKLGGLPMFPRVLAVGEKLAVTLTFAPLRPGMHPGTLHVVSDDPNVPDLAVPIAGLAGDPTIQCDGALFFGDVQLGFSARRDVICKNVGSSDLHIDLLKTSIVGANAGDFTVDLAGVANGGILHVGDSVRLPVTFTPTGHGIRDASLVVTSDDPNTPSRTIALQGNGVVGTLSLVTPKLDFGGQKVLVASAALFARLTNGLLPATIRNLELLDLLQANGMPDPASHPSWFTLNPAQVQQLPINVQAGAAVQIEVRALPGRAGDGKAILRITDGLGKWFDVTLSVTGIPANIDVNPAGHFDTVVVFASKMLTFAIRNTSMDPVSITAFDLNDGAGTFTVTRNLPAMLPVILAPTGRAGDTYDFDVTFTPPVVGPFSARIVLAVDGAAFSIALDGTGGSATLNCGPPIMTFGTLPAGSTLPRTMTCSNVGSVGLTMKPVEWGANSEPDQFSFDQPFPADRNGNPFVLQAGGTVSFNVTFAPVTVGQHRATLSIEPADPGFQPLLVKLSGTGGDAPSVEPSARSHDFGDVAYKTASQPWTVSLTNTGRLTFTIESLVATDPAFQIETSAAHPLTLAPGGTTQFAVTFKPPALGQKTARIDIAIEDGMQPAVVLDVRGNGVGSPIPLSDQPGCSCTIAGRGARSAGRLPLVVALVSTFVTLLRRHRFAPRGGERLLGRNVPATHSLAGLRRVPGPGGPGRGAAAGRS